MQLLEKTHRHQSELAAYCRTGNYSSIEGVNEKNVGQYRRLVFNVIDDTLQSAYPLTHNLLSTKEWDKLVNEFFTNHACQSPQVWYMPEELYHYLVKADHPLLKKYPFLAELLWFEWLEVKLFMMDDIKAAHVATGNMLTGKLVLNPEHQLERFTYPVHIKNARFISLTDGGNYFVAVHREPESGNVEFTDLSPAFARMIELLAEQPMTVEEVVSETCNELGVSTDPAVMEASIQFFQQALENKLILGYVV